VTQSLIASRARDDNADPARDRPQVGERRVERASGQPLGCKDA
jgi:hypothetical protein